MEKEYLYNLLLRRVRRLLEEAEENYQLGYYDLALVDLEQSLQLYLKAELLRKFGEFPRTHSLKKLFKELGVELSTEDLLVIDLLEDAYIGGRYLLKEYSKEEVELR